jgi:hypothetical protein
MNHILTHRRCRSNEFDVISFRGEECDTSHYLVVAELRVILAVRKQAMEESDMERFNHKELYKVEGRR